MKFPKTIKVGWKKYAINVKKNIHLEFESELGCDLLGVTFPDRRVMSFNIFDGYDDECLREILLHEVLHACIDMAYLDMPEDEEERVVGSISRNLFGVFKDNPGVAQLITKGQV